MVLRPRDRPPAVNPHIEPGDQVFREAAANYQRAGVAVIPTGGEDGKRPCVSGFNEWRFKPSRRTVESWAKTYPSANVGALTDLSNLTVIDVDDVDLVGPMRELFGDTPLQVETPRGGAHLYYCSNGEKSRNLRNKGWSVDIKAQGGLVILPPSRNPETGAPYRFERGGIESFANLPPINSGSLTGVGPGASGRGLGAQKRWNEMVDGDGRNVRLFQDAIKAARSAETLDELVGHLMQRNSEFREPLAEKEALLVAESAWRYKVEERIFNDRTVRARAEDITRLQKDPKAIALWMYLLNTHWGLRNEFRLPVESTSEYAGTAERVGMSANTFRRVRDRLSGSETDGKGPYLLIQRTHESSGRGDPHVYTFTETARIRNLPLKI